MTTVTKVVLPAQNVPVDTPQGVDPIWYEKLQALAASTYSTVAIPNAAIYPMETMTLKLNPKSA